MRLSAAILFCGLTLGASAAQSPSAGPMPRDYRGVQVHVDGIFVTPVPNAPFQATVQIVSTEKLPDGSDHVVQTLNRIARSSSGRIRNERRRLVAANYLGMPALLSVHLYDPNTRASTFFSPGSRLARQTTLVRPERTPTTALPQTQQAVPAGVTVTDLGDKPFNGVHLVGTRKTHIIPADQSGTGKPVTVTDEYWYSPELSLYLVIRHDDPRTGEQLVAVKDIQRVEPPADQMTVPADYKVIDETPPPAPLRTLPAVP